MLRGAEPASPLTQEADASAGKQVSDLQQEAVQATAAWLFTGGHNCRINGFIMDSTHSRVSVRFWSAAGSAKPQL